MAGVGQSDFLRVWKISAPVRTRLGEGVGADRHDHEFLEVDRVVGMGAAIDDVHHRHRQGAGRGAADIFVERQAGGLGRGLGDGERDAEDSVGAEAALVFRAVELAHHVVDADLVLGVEPGDGVVDVVVDGIDRLGHALAEIALVAVAQLDRLVNAGGGAGRHRRAAHGAVFQHDTDLDRRIAAAIKNFTSQNIDNCGHDRPFRNGGRNVAICLKRFAAVGTGLRPGMPYRDGFFAPQRAADQSALAASCRAAPTASKCLSQP